MPGGDYGECGSDLESTLVTSRELRGRHLVVCTLVTSRELRGRHLVVCTLVTSRELRGRHLVGCILRYYEMCMVSLAIHFGAIFHRLLLIQSHK